MSNEKHDIWLCEKCGVSHAQNETRCFHCGHPRATTISAPETELYGMDEEGQEVRGVVLGKDPAPEAGEGIYPHYWMDRTTLNPKTRGLRLTLGEESGPLDLRTYVEYLSKKEHEAYTDALYEEIAELHNQLQRERQKDLKLGERIGEEKAAVKYWESKAADHTQTPEMQSFAIECLSDAQKWLAELQARAAPTAPAGEEP